MDVFVDASFAREWIKENGDQAIYDPNTARFRTDFIIMYAGVPLAWWCKLQGEITLSSTKANNGTYVVWPNLPTNAVWDNNLPYYY